MIPASAPEDKVIEFEFEFDEGEVESEAEAFEGTLVVLGCDFDTVTARVEVATGSATTLDVHVKAAGDCSVGGPLVSVPIV